MNYLTLEANTLCPSFLLTFEIFNYNVHHFLVHFGASVNAMSLYVARKINAKWDKIDAQIIQVDENLIRAIGEIKNVIFKLSKYDQVHQCKNLIIVEIPKAYGVLLSRD